ncbi:tetratricopeptide repeat protein [Spirochaeta dissipatitropha]
MLLTATVFSVDFEARGKEAFMNNKPLDAAAFFELALQENPQSPDLYIYLASSYSQVGNYNRALDVYNRALQNVSAQQERLHFNKALTHYFAQDFSAAYESYSRSISVNPRYSRAYLNRGNLLVRQEKYREAIEDYRAFLAIDPENEQAPNVRKMISALEDELADARLAAERERIAQEEQERRKAEEAEAERLRREQEEIRREEERVAAEQRRRSLLDSVLESLEDSSREAEPLGAEAEDFEHFHFELGRED